MTPDLELSAAARRRLGIFADLLKKWNPAINLVSPASLSDLWLRHIADSAQLWGFRPPLVQHWVDLGSGAGFPGAVIAVLTAELQCRPDVTLIESDQRKAVFLKTVARETGVAFTVLPERIETAPQQNADVVSARALAPLSLLCSYADRHLRQNGTALFLKGGKIEPEVNEARLAWNFNLAAHPSKTDPSSFVLELSGLHRV
jgi:16S rRNA (guanine527-N7)-methyltransferase